MIDAWRNARRLLRLLDGRWTLALFAELTDAGRRYNELHSALDGISHKVLTDTLRRAERDGLISRHLDPKRVETATLYELTDLGRSLDEPLAGLARWIETYWHEVEAAHGKWDRLDKKD
jgi:DNA-binding HxlR family transcriptional regulator